METARLHSCLRRAWRRLAACALNVVLFSLVAAGPVAAHQRLRSADPADGARLSVPPRVLRLHFNEAVDLAFARIQLAGPTGRAVSLGPLRLDPDSAAQLIVTLGESLPNGRYAVTWKIAGADGHPASGRYAFEVTATPADADSVRRAGSIPGRIGAEQSSAAVAPADRVSFGVESIPFVAVRWVTYLALLTMLGAVAVQSLVLPRVRMAPPEARAAFIAEASRRASLVGIGGAVVMLLAGAARLTAQRVAMADMLDDSVLGALSTLLQTVWGWGWLLQMLATLALLISLTRTRLPRRRGLIAAAASALVVAVTPALSGHAVATSRPVVLTVAADTVHVLATGGWIGTLLLLLVAVLPAALRTPEGERHDAVAATILAFSPVALGCAALALLTGGFAAWTQLGTLPALWATSYGRTLLLKLGVLFFVVAMGAWNWRRVTPTLGTAHGTQRLRRAATVEVLIAVVVLAVTAVLVALPTPAGGAH